MPAATTWPPPLLLAAVSPCRCRTVATSSGSPPTTALIPVGVTALAAAMARPRSRTNTIACSTLSTPASGGGGDLTHGVPGGGADAAAQVGRPLEEAEQR